MRVVFFCPPVSVINGGIKHIFRMAEALIADGRDAVVFEQNGAASNLVRIDRAYHRARGLCACGRSLYVLPEDQPHILADFAKFPSARLSTAKIIFTARSASAMRQSYADYGVTDILCSSQTIYDHCRLRHPTLRAYVVPCAVDPVQFKPAAIKQNVIAFMPRKRAIEAAYIRDMFRFAYPQYRDWQWREIAERRRGRGGAHDGRSAGVFIAKPAGRFWPDASGSNGSGCVVAGFTGIGGREYANAENGFWVDEDDFPACVKALAAAVELSLTNDTAHAAACRKTLHILYAAKLSASRD